MAFTSHHPLSVRNWYFDASATNGDINGNGTIGSPYQTIDKFIALMPGTIGDNDSVLFKRGYTYKITATVAITRPLKISAYGTGTRPVISALKALTFINVGTNMWRSVETVTTTSMLDMVTRNDFNIQKGRWPNEDDVNSDHGYNTVLSASSNSCTSGCTMHQTTGSELTGMPVIYAGAQVVSKPEEFWPLRQTINSYDPTNKIISFDKDDSAEYSPRAGWGYFITNDSATLDEDYEWWLNTSNHTLKVFKNGSAPTGISASIAENIFVINDVSNVSITNLELDGSNKDAIVLSGSGSNENISYNYLHNCGRNCISNGTDHSTLTHNVIKDVCNDGIIVQSGGDHFTIEYDTITAIGQLMAQTYSMRQDGGANHNGDGVYAVRAGFGSISYNVIRNVGYSGIHFKKYDSLLMNYNYIDSFCTRFNDGGGFYGFKQKTDGTAHGRTIIGNTILHGIANTDGDPNTSSIGKGTACIYMDEWTDNVDIHGNFCEGAFQGIFCNWGCNHNTVRNNTLVGNQHQLQLNTRTPDTARNLTVKANICLSTAASQQCIHLYSDDDASLLQLFGTIDSNYYLRPLATTNYLHRQAVTGGAADVSLTSWRNTFPYDDHSNATLFTYGSQAVQDTSLRIEYNETGFTKTVRLLANYQNAVGTTYGRGYITIPPYSSNAPLFKTGLILLYDDMDPDVRIRGRKWYVN